MAKRGAEAVACRAPCQLRSFPRAPPSKRSRSDLERRESLWRENGGEKKRKWTVVAEGGDEAGAGGKRLAEGTARREPEQRIPIVAGMASKAAALAGGDATGSQGGPEKGRASRSIRRESFRSGGRRWPRGASEGTFVVQTLAKAEREYSHQRVIQVKFSKFYVGQLLSLIDMTHKIHDIQIQPEDDVWHYNSFQFWKLPLPTIDLSDIQELEKGSITETSSSSNTSLSEMET